MSRFAFPFIVIFNLLASVSCVSSPVILNGTAWDHSRKPEFVDYVDYYFWGLSGHPSINLQKICMDQKPLAAEALRSIEDGIITLVTLGIYAPMTIRVWCGD